MGCCFASLDLWYGNNDSMKNYVGVSLMDHIQNEEIRRRTKVDDVIEHIAGQKCR